MLHGKVLRPSAFEATLTSLDETAARAIPGVTVVRDGSFIGVTAPDSFTATRAVAALQPQWNEKTQPSATELFDLLAKPRPSADQQAGANAQPGSADQAARAANAGPVDDLRRLERRYTISYIAHAPLEPRAAVAQWQDDKLTVWTGTQRPFGVRSELARTFELDEAKVRVIAPTPAPVTAANIPAKPPSKRRDLRKPPANRSNSSGRGKRNSPGHIFVPRE
jgi:isoquinoline 1-oxidoreductase